jgi:hypothetical protein
MRIQNILDKLDEENISLWDLKSFTITITDSDGKQRKIKNFKLNADDKTIRVRLD